ncbi:MAG TPA: cation diffusion facilitator family transporter [Candidatus Omnitrophota bacterium]|nr:cation diffusion facilitator family transporter [Candidatus Omnitrophota bacterium]
MAVLSKIVHAHRPKQTSSSDDVFEYRSVARKRLWLALTVMGIVMLAEVAGGILSNSLALVSDAGHMFTHFFVLAVSLGAIFCAARPACHHRTFGFFRVEVLAALFNSLSLFGITGWIVYESVLRILYPAAVMSLRMLSVAVVGLAANLINAALLRGTNKNDLNVQSAFVHMVADTLSSVAIIIGAIIIRFTGWDILDPLLGIAIALVILRWGWGLFMDSVHILLEGAPKGLTTDIVKKALLEGVPQIREICDLHIWTITSDMYSMTAQVRLTKECSMEEWKDIKTKIKAIADERFDIEHVTIEFD